MSTPVPMTAQESIMLGVAPNGRRFKVDKYQANPQLWEIVYADNKGGDLPGAFHLHKFTKSTIADNYLALTLTEYWKEAESKSPRRTVNA